MFISCLSYLGLTNLSGWLDDIEKSVTFARLLPVISIVVPATTPRQCTKKRVDDTEDHDDDNNTSNITHKSFVLISINVYCMDILSHRLWDSAECPIPLTSIKGRSQQIRNINHY